MSEGQYEEQHPLQPLNKFYLSITWQATLAYSICHAKKMSYVFGQGCHQKSYSDMPKVWCWAM